MSELPMFRPRDPAHGGHPPSTPGSSVPQPAPVPPQPSTAPIEPDPDFNLADLFAPKPAAAAGGAAGIPPEDPGMREKVEKVVNELRPYIHADGGDITVVSVREGVVKVKLHGACDGCSSSMYTLQLGIEKRLREEVPGIKYVEAV
jgi:Fe-S cluster biogenesis protein NfuA